MADDLGPRSTPYTRWEGPLCGRMVRHQRKANFGRWPNYRFRPGADLLGLTCLAEFGLRNEAKKGELAGLPQVVAHALVVEVFIGGPDNDE